jgi:hypothetical protein
MFEDFLRLHAQGSRGRHDHAEQGGGRLPGCWGTFRLLGLSDLRKAENRKDGIYYDDCYREDHDNYIDIILIGDDAAARNITAVQIPSVEGGKKAFYNPGDPGPKPFPRRTRPARPRAGRDCARRSDASEP